MIYFMYAMNIVFILIKYSHYISFILAVIYIFLKLIKHPEMNCNRVISFVIFQAVVYFFLFCWYIRCNTIRIVFRHPIEQRIFLPIFPKSEPVQVQTNYKLTTTAWKTTKDVI